MRCYLCRRAQVAQPTVEERSGAEPVLAMLPGCTHCWYCRCQLPVAAQLSGKLRAAQRRPSVPAAKWHLHQCAAPDGIQSKAAQVPKATAAAA